MKCFIIDIDGTVANGDHRLHHIQKEPKAWDDYFLACGSDAPIAHMHDVVCGLSENFQIVYVSVLACGSDAPIAHMHDVVCGLSENFQIVYVSGRSDLVRQQTIDWLDSHGFPCDALYMRKQGDHENDDTLKIKLLAQVRADGYEPIMAFDDRNRVVAAWRAAGIPCAQVAPGDF